MRLLLIVLAVVLIIGCRETAEEKEGMTEVTGSHVNQLEKTACTTADKAGTCQSRLVGLGFITEEECCEKFQKCCAD